MGSDARAVDVMWNGGGRHRGSLPMFIRLTGRRTLLAFRIRSTTVLHPPRTRPLST